VLIAQPDLAGGRLGQTRRSRGSSGDPRPVAAGVSLLQSLTRRGCVTAIRPPSTQRRVGCGAILRHRLPTPRAAEAASGKSHHCALPLLCNDILEVSSVKTSPCRPPHRLHLLGLSSVCSSLCLCRHLVFGVQLRRPSSAWPLLRQTSSGLIGPPWRRHPLRCSPSATQNGSHQEKDRHQRH
jgi:hypothetical protein